MSNSNEEFFVNEMIKLARFDYDTFRFEEGFIYLKERYDWYRVDKEKVRELFANRLYEELYRINEELIRVEYRKIPYYIFILEDIGFKLTLVEKDELLNLR